MTTQRNVMLIIVPPPAARFYLNSDGNIHLEFNQAHVERIQAWVQGLVRQTGTIGDIAGGLEPGWLIAKKQSGKALTEEEEEALTKYLLSTVEKDKPPPVMPAHIPPTHHAQRVEPVSVPMTKCPSCERPVFEPPVNCPTPDAHQS